MGSGRSSTRSRSRSARSPPRQTPSSSVDSNSDPPSPSSSPSSSPPRLCLSTANDCNDDHAEAKSSFLDMDLRLGLRGGSASASTAGNIHIARIEVFREKRHDWPPIRPRLRSTIGGKFFHDRGRGPCLFVKVYMEGVPIGGKLDLLAHNDCDDLIKSLARMFNTNIRRPGESVVVDRPSGKLHMLTYEDKDGDWMMVGDVPWEMFKITVKRMMITRADKC